MQLAERINAITVSPTLAVMAEAERYKARGIDVVDFGPGEPDFPTPDHIKRAAIAAIEQNFTKYTPAAGIAPLRKAICEWHAAQFGSTYAPNECIVSVGGKHAIFNAINVLINPGDEVLIPVPYWVSFPDIVKYAGGRPEYIQTEAKDGFRLRAEQVDSAIGPRTRILILNSPCNPTGAVVPPDEFLRIFEVCKRRGVWLLSDECYSHFVYGEARPFSISSVPESKPHIITIGSCSKTFAMTGWRMGYALSPAPLTEAMLKLQSQSTSNPTSIAQHAAVAAMTGSMESVGTMLAEYAKRRERIIAGMRAIRGITCTEPQGAFYVFPNFEALLGDGIQSTADLAKQLLEREHLAVVPGEAFGAPGYLRFSYATSMERIEEGLKRLGRFFQSASAAP